MWGHVPAAGLDPAAVWLCLLLQGPSASFYNPAACPGDGGSHLPSCPSCQTLAHFPFSAYISAPDGEGQPCSSFTWGHRRPLCLAAHAQRLVPSPGQAWRVGFLIPSFSSWDLEGSLPLPCWWGALVPRASPFVPACLSLVQGGAGGTRAQKPSRALHCACSRHPQRFLLTLSPSHPGTPVPVQQPDKVRTQSVPVKQLPHIYSTGLHTFHGLTPACRLCPQLHQPPVPCAQEPRQVCTLLPLWCACLWLYQCETRVPFWQSGLALGGHLLGPGPNAESLQSMAHAL